MIYIQYWKISCFAWFGIFLVFIVIFVLLLMAGITVSNEYEYLKKMIIIMLRNTYSEKVHNLSSPFFSFYGV